MKKPFSHPVIMSVLAFVASAGGYGGYSVLKHHETYGYNFETRPHTVMEVVDGDTLIIENNIRIRLLGIDAPESTECYSTAAKTHLESLVLGRDILLEKDQTAKDSFDRLLRYAFIHNPDPEGDQLFVQHHMVKNGAAHSLYLKPNRRYLAQLQADERSAQENELGLWGVCGQRGQVENTEREIASDPFSTECVIKGNVNKRYEKDYFLPGCPNYKRVKIDPRKDEAWFCTEAEAVAAGWQKSAACSNIWQSP